MKRFLVTVLIVLCPTLTLSDFDEKLRTVEALRADKIFAEALEIIVPMANNKSVDAQLVLAEMYFGAQGLKKDNDRAMYWACRAAASRVYKAEKFRLKLALQAISKEYQPPQCGDTTDL